MAEDKGNVPADWKRVLDASTISRSLSRISYEILEQHRDLKRLSIVGIRTGGEHLGLRIKKKIEEIEGVEVSFGVVDITLYRDDISHSAVQPILKGTDLPFEVSGSRIILVDDVLYTGRTVRAALDAIIDFGRPNCVELAVLVDRGLSLDRQESHHLEMTLLGCNEDTRQRASTPRFRGLTPRPSISPQTSRPSALSTRTP